MFVCFDESGKEARMVVIAPSVDCSLFKSSFIIQLAFLLLAVSSRAPRSLPAPSLTYTSRPMFTV